MFPQDIWNTGPEQQKVLHTLALDKCVTLISLHLRTGMSVDPQNCSGSVYKDFCVLRCGAQSSCDVGIEEAVIYG